MSELSWPLHAVGEESSLSEVPEETWLEATEGTWSDAPKGAWATLRSDTVGDAVVGGRVALAETGTLRGMDTLRKTWSETLRGTRSDTLWGSWSGELAEAWMEVLEGWLDTS